MDEFEVVVNVLAVIIAFAIPFMFFAFMRYLRYRETIALAERGLLRPERRQRSRDMLNWGIVITMIGLALICGLWPLGFMFSGSGPAEVGPETSLPPGPAVGESGGSSLPFGIGPWLVLGMLPFFFGLSLIIIYWVNKREDTAEAGNRANQSDEPVDQDKAGP